MNTQPPAPPSAVRLSEARVQATGEGLSDGKILVLIGSFAPVHLGHLELIQNASNWLDDQERKARAVVLVPNSQSYVAKKLSGSEHQHLASIDERLSKMEKFLPAALEKSGTPVYIDDISCMLAKDGEFLNVICIETILKALGGTTDDIIVILGSDQLKSMQPYWRSTETVVISRPGYNDEMYAMLRKRWVQKALRLFKLSIVDRPEGCVSMSSTKIREQWSREIRARHLSIDTVMLKVLKKNPDGTYAIPVDDIEVDLGILQDPPLPTSKEMAFPLERMEN